MTSDSPQRRIALAALRAWLRRNPCLFLLVSLLCFMLGSPLLHGFGRRVTVGVIMSIILVASVYAVARRRRVMIAAVIVGIPYFAAMWSYQIDGSPALGVTEASCGVIFFAFTTISLLGFVLGPARVTSDTLFGAACVYLLIGLTWANIYIVAYLIDPAAISRLTDAASDNPVGLGDFTYYSFVTLTTLGYGDIVPRTDFARALAIVESICGVLYLAFLVARLVAMYGTRGIAEPK